MEVIDISWALILYSLFCMSTLGLVAYLIVRYILKPVRKK